MDELQKLIAIHAIRHTKGTYWYALDTKNWDLFASVFTEDAVMDMRYEAAFAHGRKLENPPSIEEAIAAGDPSVVVGRAKFKERIRTAVGPWRTVHHGHEPVIDILSADTASAIWPLFDYIDNGTRVLKGYGHYHEDYRRQDDGKWLISFMRLTRLRGDGEHPILG